MFKGRKELYSELVSKIVNTANYEQLSIMEAVELAINQCNITANEVNEIWSLIYVCVDDIFNQECYKFRLNKNKLESYLHKAIEFSNGSKIYISGMDCNHCKYVKNRGSASNNCIDNCIRKDLL